MTNVSKKIETIKSIFLNTQQFYELNDPTVLLEYLKSIKPEFRSIGYEAASMDIAVNDFEKEKELSIWLLFANGPAIAHKAQVHVGLGWAIAKMNLPFLSAVEKIEQQLYYRIIDGCGYYDGFFRSRHVIVNQELPGYMPKEAMNFYDQGLGRNLWYSLNADINLVKNTIENFDSARQAAMWRGVGIAVAYVGGVDEQDLKTIFNLATKNSLQLTMGAALAAKSRIEANTLIADTTLCSQLWFQLCRDANLISIDTTAGNNDGYLNWIIKTENDLASSFKIG